MPVRSLVPARLLLALALLVLVVALCVAGYVWVEGWSWFDSFYMTVTTITTLGGGEPRPLSYAGRWWTLVVIVLGVGAWAYTFLALSAYLLEGHQSDSEAKLRFAGATSVISPYYIGGKRMASLALRPTAVEFIDTVLEAGNTDLLLENVTMPRGSSAVGKMLGTFTGNSSDVIVLALKRNNHMMFRPSDETLLEIGDEIVVAGPRDAIHQLESRL